jgi:hypothetical protein
LKLAGFSLRNPLRRATKDYSASNARLTWQHHGGRNVKWLLRHMKNTTGNTYSAPERLGKSIFDIR